LATAERTHQRPRPLIYVAPCERLELANAHAGRVEHEQRQPIETRQQRVHSEHVGGGRWRELSLLFAGELHASIAGRVRLNAVVVEDHREHRDPLSDGLLATACVGELGDHRRFMSEAGVSPKRGRRLPRATSVGLHRSLAYVDASGLPGLGELAERRLFRRLAQNRMPGVMP
jgi:hypothetical protein